MSKSCYIFCLIFNLGHVLPRRLLSPSLSFGTYDTYATYITNGHKIFIQSRRGQVYVNNAKLIDGDIMALNAAIHIIDTVLFTDLNLTNPEPTTEPTTETDTTTTPEPTTTTLWSEVCQGNCYEIWQHCLAGCSEGDRKCESSCTTNYGDCLNSCDDGDIA